MDIQDMGAIGEVLGSVAVLITLVYLALQIRQANSIASWETHRSSVAANSHTMNAIICNEDVAKIFRDGLLGIESLGPTDRIRFHMILDEIILNFKDILDAHDRGLFDSQTYEAWLAYVSSLMNMPGGEVWWKENCTNYTARLQEDVGQRKMIEGRYDAKSPTVWMS